MQDLVDVVWDGALTGRFDASPLSGRLSIDEGESERGVILTITYIVVAFSIVVQGLTIGPLVRRWLPEAKR